MEGESEDMLHVGQPTLEDLNREHIKKLVSFLDPNDYPVNWLQVGKHVYHENEVMLEKVDQLRLSYSGGGSPAAAFIEYVKTCLDCTLNDFLSTAKKLGRNDIANRIQNYGCIDYDMKFSEVDNLLTDRLSVMLDNGGGVTGTKNWCDFAYELGCDKDRVNQFKAATISKQCFSPTESLLKMIEASHPNYMLCEFSVVLRDLGRYDVKMYIDDLMESLSA